MRIFWFAFLGKTVAALFLALCAALSIGPSWWAAMILGTEPTLWARGVFGLLAVGTAIAIFGPMIGNAVRRLRSPITTGPIPVAISDVRERVFANYAGLFGDIHNDPRDAQALEFGDANGDVTITNTSKTDRVALDIVLRITTNDGVNISARARAVARLVENTDRA